MALTFSQVLTMVLSAKKAVALIAAISRAALIIFTAILATMLVVYSIGNIISKEIEKAKAEDRKHIEGTHTVYVLIANGGSIGSGIFYVGRTKNFNLRFRAHKANPEKIAAGG